MVAVEGEEALEAVAEAAVSEEVAAEEWEAAEVRNTVRKHFTSFTFSHLDCWMIRKSSLPFKFS